MPELQNAHPTVLNPVDLPTRRRRTSSSGKAHPHQGSLFSHLPPPHVEDPFSETSSSDSEADDDDEDAPEPIDEQEIYDLISTISDPEHPLSLGSLAVVSLHDISIRPTIPSSPRCNLQTVTVLVTPTITHCSMATIIGLGVRVRLEQSLPPRFRVDVKIKPGAHSTADETTKQLADKERVAAAMENSNLTGLLTNMLATCQ